MGSMRNIAVAVATALVFAMVAPAFAQPFADVPTNHWAYDAIAELAAKGLIEGYPDGTFKGDRAMTRYEMAMVVARLLARIESIQIPAPTPPEVTKADLDAVNRLVNEFRAELAALGVRTTAIEEELNAIKARLDNVRITGGLRFREDVGRGTYGTGTGLNLTGASQTIVGGTPNGAGVAFNLGTVGVNANAGTVGAGTAQFLQGASGATSPFGINGNPRSSQLNSNVEPTTNRPRYEFKLGFDGSVMPDLHYVIGLLSQGGYQFFNSGQTGTTNAGGLAFGNEAAGAAFGNGAFGEIDSAFLDWRNAWGLPLEIMLGRFGDNTPCGGGCYPIQWGPFGLIMNDGGDTWEDSTASGGFNQADGLRIQSHIPSAADLQFEFAIVRIQGNNSGVFGGAASPAISAGQYIFGEDAYGANANIQVIPGLRVGLDYVANTITPSNNTPGPGGFGNAAQWHVYGPGGGSINPGLGSAALSSTGFHCVSVTAISPGIACPASGNGWDGYVDWAIVPGINFDGEYGQWNDTVFSTSDNGYKVNVHWDLGSLLGIGHNFSANTGYENFGQNFYPPYGAAEIDINENDFLYPGNGSAFTIGLSISPFTGWTVYGNGAFGNSSSNGQTLSTYEAGIVYNFSQNATIVFKVREAQIAATEQFLLYRAQIDYSF